MEDILVETLDKKYAVCIEGRFYGWAFYKHPDGQWVTLRKANNDEISQAIKIFEDKIKQENLQNIDHKSTT
jgi:cytochrome oxidase Cu insertion factor (SCO1/SenC/PrrC family)